MNNPYISVQMHIPRSFQRFISGLTMLLMVAQALAPGMAQSPAYAQAKTASQKAKTESAQKAPKSVTAAAKKAETAKTAPESAKPVVGTSSDNPANTVQTVPAPIELTTCTLYGYHDQSASDSQFFRMNLQTSVETHIGSIATGEDIEAIDTQPSTGTIYGFPDNGSDDSSAVLVTINRDTGARTFVANVSSDYELPGASFNPITGELWASADTNDNLYTINLATGAPTLKLDASKTGEPQALAWNNAGTTLYVAYDDKVYTTNGTSALVQVADVSGEIEAMEFDELGNLLVDMHGNEHLYVLQGSTLVDTNVDFADDDIETLTTACPIEQPKGSLRVTKVVDSGDAQPHEFGFRLSGTGSYTYPANGQDWVVFSDLNPGTYTVTEQLVAGYEQVSTTCDDVAVASGQQASCVMHNRIIVQPVCQLEITKSHDRQTAAPGDTITYRLDFANTGTGNCTGGGVKVKDVLDDHLAYVTDSQTSSPNVSFGYGATPGHQNGTLLWNAQTLTPAESGWVTFQAMVGPVDDCQEIQIPNQGKIWSNETGWLDSNIVTTDVATRCPESPQLTVIKHVVGGTNIAADFTMMVGGVAFAGSETGVTNTFDPGDYTVTETGPAGYTLTYSGDCNSQGQVTLANDEHKTCTLTNTRDQGRVKIVKVLSDQSDPSAWTFDVTGYGTMNHDQYATLDAGSYAVTEQGPAGYTLDHVEGICDTVEGKTFQLNVTANGGICTVYNTINKGSLTVTKVVDSGSALPEEFGFRIDDGAYTYPATGQDSVLFDDLTPGTYTATETDPAGYHQVSTTCDNVSVAPDQDATCVIHNARDTGRIIVHKDVDTDGDGQVDETDVTDWTWSIVDRSYQTPVISDIPTGEGRDVPTGTYWVDEDQKPGFHVVEAVCDEEGYGPVEKVDVPVEKDQTVECTFTNARDTGDITGTKFNDLNGNGIRDEGEPGIEGVQMELNTGAQTASAADGSFAFNDLPTGDYTVSETVPEGWVNTTPTSVDVTVVKDETASVTFGNQELPEGSPILVVDKTDSPDPVAVGQQLTYTIRWAVGGDATAMDVMLTDPLDVHESFVSASNGGTYDPGTRTVTWELGNQEPGGTGEVTLVVLVDESAVSSEGTVLENTVTISADNATPTEDTEDTTVLGRIIGTKFNDLNGNGIRDAGEPAIEGWTIMLASACPTNFAAYDLVPSGQIDGSDLSAFAAAMGSNDMGKADLDKSAGITQADVDCFTDMLGANVNDPMIASTWTTQTDANGNYRFDVEPGSYLVSEEQREGWMQTSEPAVYGPVVIASGQEAQDLDFGNFQLGSIAGTKFEDQTGDGASTDDTALDGVTIRLWRGSELVAEQITHDGGQFAFENLPAGTYALTEVLTDGWVATVEATGNIVIESGKGSTGNDFRNFQRVDLTATKLLDADGTLDTTGDQTPAADWTMQLWKDGAQIGADVQTAADGTVTWTDLGPGAYTVKEVFDADAFEALTATEMTVALESGKNADVTFINTQRPPNIVVEKPELTIEKSVDVTTFVNPGDDVVYTVVIANVGNGTAHNVVLDDTLPDHLKFLSNNTQQHHWNLGDLAAGDEITVSYTVRVMEDTPAGTYDNLAVADSDDTPQVKDSAQIEVRVPKVNAEESTPKLTIDKTVNVPFANSGSTVRYTVVVQNIGEAVAENVILNDTLPLGFTFVETGGQTRQWSLGDLKTGDTVTTSYDVKIATTVVPGTYPNLAVARADNHPPVTDLVNLDVRRGVVLAEQLPRTGGDLGQMMLTFGAALLTLLSMLAYSVRRWITNAASAVYALLISRKTSGINTLANFSQNTEAGQTSATAWSSDTQ